MHQRLFERIQPLFDVGSFADATVLIAGCGSGGGNVASQLVMSGIKKFILADNDILEAPNVIRHVCGIRYLGWKKTDALEDVIHDRNPDAVVKKLNIDLLAYDGLENEISASTVVVMATDNDQTRYRINELCVRLKRPFVVGKVFTRGIGGEVFAYRPHAGGCLACLEKRLERTPFRQGIREVDLVTPEERDKMYGMEAAEIKDSPGLNVDISFITAFHTRYVLDCIAGQLAARPQFLYPIPENYLIWGNRPVPPFDRNFHLQRINLNPQEGCLVCGGA